MDAKDYEDLVGRVYEDLPTGGADRILVRRREHFIGKRTGHAHEIDLAFEFRIVDVRFLVLVECKAYKRKVGVDDLLEFAQRLDDIGAHKGIFVTTVGYEPGAIKVARGHRIALVVTTPTYHTILPSISPEGNVLMAVPAISHNPDEYSHYLGNSYRVLGETFTIPTSLPKGVADIMAMSYKVYTEKFLFPGWDFWRKFLYHLVRFAAVE